MYGSTPFWPKQTLNYKIHLQPNSCFAASLNRQKNVILTKFFSMKEKHSSVHPSKNECI